MSLTVIEQADAKVNLSLLLGPARQDGRHELVTVFDSLRLSDELIVGESPDRVDEVICEGVSGPNLVSDALAGLRAAGWEAPPVRVEIWKRIPVAAGMGGGSADAAAMLRAASRLSPIDPDRVASIALRLGADVPSRLLPGPSLGTGAGELVRALPPLETYAVLVLPQPFGLSTAAVYREADRLGLGRSAAQLSAAADELVGALSVGGSRIPGELAVNDLQPAALSLAPGLSEVLEAARGAGAQDAMVCGSGPTVVGLFHGLGAGARARAAAADPGLRARFPRAVAAAPRRSAQSGSPS